MSRIFKRGDALKTSLTVLGSLFLTAGVVVAATTISTNISTGGTLEVTGATTMSTASSTGLAKLNSLQLTAGLGATKGIDTVEAGTLNIGGTNATTLTLGQTGQTVAMAGAATVAQTLGVTGVSTLTGNTILSTASSTGAVSVHSLKVSATGSTVGGMVFGLCNVAASTAVTASSTAYVDCTGATGITTSYKAFVQATSSLQYPLSVRAASSTADNVIQLEIYNPGHVGDITTAASAALNFFGIK